ncbi:MAG: TolC family protein [Prolixibacteraceae bacterium]|nr:TolC family protein [Prolixibacteraceae bacterium]
MKSKFYSFFLTCLIIPSLFTEVKAQKESWTYDDCKNYALENNVQIKKAILTNDRNAIQLDQAKSNRLPNVSASVSQNFGWGKSMIETGQEYGGGSINSRTNLNVGSNVTLFNGFRLQNEVKQSELSLEAGRFNAESVKESVEINILNSFLQVLYAKEQVNNAKKQIESTEQELTLAKERMDLGAIPKSNYLQIKSQMATEKLTLANSEKQLRMAEVNLMQLMELPVTEDFEIADPDIQKIIGQNNISSSEEVFNIAKKIKPQIKNAEINTKNAQIEIDIAKAGMLPSITLNAGLGTNATSQSSVGYFDQMGSYISPSLGLSLSIPIYQKNQAKNSVKLAKIGIDDAKLNELNTQNELRKNIEQVCSDVQSARIEYEASIDQYESVTESYNVALERFNQGLINSVDFLVQKTNLISSESKLLQAKYNLVFSHKILDFYMGTTLTLE